eukprot:6583184-Pyramimonas_sp.AAC.1
MIISVLASRHLSPKSKRADCYGPPVWHIGHWAITRHRAVPRKNAPSFWRHRIGHQGTEIITLTTLAHLLHNALPGNVPPNFAYTRQPCSHPARKPHSLT